MIYRNNSPVDTSETNTNNLAVVVKEKTTLRISPNRNTKQYH